MTDEPLGLSPAQTVGPFFHYGLTPGGHYPVRDVFSADLTAPGVEGQRIRIVGRVTDADGVGVPDAMVEIWQADATGSYAHGVAGGARDNAGFKGFGRAPTGGEGEFSFETILPGASDGQAPHVNVSLFARGMLRRLFTRLYFDGEPRNATDPALAIVPAARRGTLLARPAGEGAWRFDIALRGEAETVFFEA